MLDRIKLYKRYKDYFTFKCIEVKLTVLFTVMFIIFMFYILDIYNTFSVYRNIILDIIQCIIGGEFGLIGMSLAGMAIITSLITPDMLYVIKKIDKKDVINRLMSQFEFSALNIGIQIVYLILISLCLVNETIIIGRCTFTIIFGIVTYHLFFNLFYVIALIGNCIKINSIKNSCNTITAISKSTVDIANEIRIELLTAIILKENGIKKDDYLKDLDTIVDKTPLENKDSIREYFHNYYKF